VALFALDDTMLVAGVNRALKGKYTQNK